MKIKEFNHIFTSFELKVTYLLLSIYMIGYAINRAISKLEIFANGLQGVKCSHKLNNLLSGICLLIHFICTIFMIF